MMKKMILLVMGLVAGATTHAQEIETTVAADVVSSYIWRGQDLGSAAIQPTLGIGGSRRYEGV